MVMRDDGEPISRGQLDRRAAEARALQNALFSVALFTGVVLVNGILAFIVIELFQSIGWWEVPALESAEDATARVTPGLRLPVGHGTWAAE